MHSGITHRQAISAASQFDIDLVSGPSAREDGSSTARGYKRQGVGVDKTVSYFIRADEDGADVIGESQLAHDMWKEISRWRSRSYLAA